MFFITALIYLALTYSITRLLRYIERRMDGPDNYTFLGSETDSKSILRVHKEAAK